MTDAPPETGRHQPPATAGRNGRPDRAGHATPVASGAPDPGRPRRRLPRLEPSDFAHDLLLDVYLQGDQRYWLRRARQFQQVGTPACDEIAQACRNRATLRDLGHIRELVALVLAEGHRA